MARRWRGQALSWAYTLALGFVLLAVTVHTLPDVHVDASVACCRPIAKLDHRAPVAPVAAAMPSVAAGDAAAGVVGVSWTVWSLLEQPRIVTPLRI
ncbi:MAG: hypothetical protein QN178_04810 [Armatimonadota bacterium]|nr:hypothetical protein [Armatimonadota bacterium]